MFFSPDEFLLFSCLRPCVRVGIEAFLADGSRLGNSCAWSLKTLKERKETMSKVISITGADRDSERRI
jgi:hypothetical protein